VARECSKKFPRCAAIVKQPERWDRIVQARGDIRRETFAGSRFQISNDFLLKRKAADPDHFAIFRSA